MKQYLFPSPAELDRYEIISFDLFDTLITRNTDTSHHIFLKQGKVFWFLRRYAEILTRKLYFFSKKEISINDIYKLIPFYDKGTELFLEEKYSLVVKEGFETFLHAHALKKQIYIISDMYLPSLFLKRLLSIHKFPEPYKLVVSNEYGISKTQGLFNLIFNETEKKSVLHLGDNLNADFLAPKLAGIDAIRVLKS